MIKYIIGILILAMVGVHTLSLHINNQLAQESIKATLEYKKEVVSPNLNNKNNIKLTKITDKFVKPKNQNKALSLNSKKTLVKERKTESQPRFKSLNISDVESLDFTPSFNESVKTNDVRSINEREIKFTKVDKQVVIKEEQIKQAKSTKNNNNNDVFDEAYLNINGEDPIKAEKITRLTQIEEKNLVALMENIKFPKEQKEKYIAKNILPKIEEPIKPIIRKQKLDKSTDRISTVQAANEKSNTKESRGNNNKQEMGLAFYDYSKDKEKSAESQKSEMKKKIESLMKTSVGSQIVTNTNSTTGDEVSFSGKNEVSNPLNFNKIIAKSGSKNSPKGNDTYKINDDIVNPNKLFSNNKLLGEKKDLVNAFGKINLSNTAGDKLNKFDIIFNDDINNRATSNADGSYKFNYNLNNEYSIRRLTFLSSQYVPTSIDLVLMKGDNSLNVPMMSRDKMNRLYEKEGLRGLGGTALIELDNMTEDIDLGVDSRYEKKLYLNKKLNAVNRSDSDFYYIMFVGVEPGNHIMSFRTFKNQVTNKIVHLVDDEIYFDLNFYNKIEKDSFELVEEHLLTKDKSPLDITSEEITDVNFDSKVSMLTMNNVEVKGAIYPHSTRKYYQLSNRREPIFIGRYNAKKVTIPSESYIREVMYNFNVRTSDKDCVVQINLSKEAKSFNINGISSNRIMRPSVRILDSDGIFYKSLSNESKRIFVLGREQGMLSLQITYTDDSKDYIQTYCSDSTYLVEQL